MGRSGLFNHRLLAFCTGVLFWYANQAMAQNVLPNPMLRPDTYQNYGKPSPAEVSEEAPEQQSGDPEVSQPSQSSPDAGLALQPSTTTQESLALEQQKLNSARVPQPLSKVFTGMELVGHYGSDIVMRFQPNSARAAEASSGGDTGGGGGSVPLPAVLYFTTGTQTQFYGYTLRIRQIASNISFEWYSEQEKNWINVYNASLEGGTQASFVPATLEPVSTSDFDYLKPSGGESGFSSGSSGSSSSSSSGSN